MVASEIYGKRILFGVLNWGLGHATRSTVLIHQFLQQNNQVIIASSGQALQFLRTQFPQLSFYEMPTREIIYPNHRQLWLKLLFQQKKIFDNIKAEKNTIDQVQSKINHQQSSIDIIISDNCYGFFHPEIPSMLLTHQVNIQAPFLEKIAQKRIHRLLLPFHEIWIPDLPGEENLSGKLSRPVLPVKNFTYIGPLSATSLIPAPEPIPVVYDYCAVISGPEKQRTLFEKIVIDFLLAQKVPAVLIRGTNTPFSQSLPDYIRVENVCTPQEVKNFLQQSHTAIGRTGYTTIMDLYALQKPCILLPTPGQTEQEYLFAKHFGKKTGSLRDISPKIISPCKG